MRNFLTILDLTRDEAHAMVRRAKEMKETRFRSDLLADKTIAMIFEKASTRTRLSFEMAIKHLGGSTVFMTPQDSQLGRSEPLSDTARVMSRYLDGMVVRPLARKSSPSWSNTAPSPWSTPSPTNTTPVRS